MRILQSKLQVPTCSKYLIHRTRLLDSINFRSPNNLYILKAPAGFGKTTFAAQLYAYLPTNHFKTWITVDENEQDTERLLHYIVTGLFNSSHELSDNIKLEELLSNSSSIVERTDDLCFLFQEKNKNIHWLFLDNWESADNNKNGKIINQLIQHTNQKLKIVMTSRINPSFNISRLQEKELIKILSQKDLRFSFTEFMESLTIRKLNFEKQELEQLWKLSKGWCINTAFIDESSKQKKFSLLDTSKDYFNFKLSENYILEEFISNLDITFIKRLIKSSFSKIITPEILSILFDSEKETKDFLKQLKLSSIPYSEYRTNEFTYHPIFQNALSKIAQDKLDKTEIHSINNKLNTYYISKEMYLDALEKVSMLDCEVSLLEFIDTHWLQLIEQGGLKVIKNLLIKISKNNSTHRLYIKLYANVLSQINDNSTLVKFLSNKIEPSLFEKSDVLLSSLWVKYYWAILHSTNSPSYKEVLASWEKIEKIKGPFQERDKIGVEITLSCAAYTELNFDKAKFHINKSIKYIGDSSFVYKINQLDNLAIFDFYTGNIEKALQIYRDNLEKSKRKKVFHGMSNRLLQIAWILISSGEIKKGLDTINEAEQILFKHESFDIQAKMFAEHYKGISYFYLGYFELAMKKLRNSLQFAKKYNEEEIVYTNIYIDYFELLSGSRKTLLSKDEIHSIEKYSQSNLLYLVYESYIGFLNKKKKKCLDNANQLMAICIKSKLSAWQALASFLLALHAELSNDYSLSSNFYLEGLSILQKHKIRSYPMYNNIITERLVIHAIKNGKTQFINKIIGSDYSFEFSTEIENLVKRIKFSTKNLEQLFSIASANTVRGLVPIADRYVTSNQKTLKVSAKNYLNIISSIPLPPLNINMFGAFYVLSDNRQIKFKRKKSKQLLQILTLKYPLPVNEEELIELLWPNSEFKKGKTSLRTAIKDLRKYLDPHHLTRKDSYILNRQSQYQLNLPDDSSIDIVSFKNLSYKILSTQNSYSDKTCIEHCFKCVQLYDNRLLTEDLNSMFAIEEREFFHLTYQKIVLKFSESLIHENRFEEAVIYLEKALTYDHLWREGTEKLIKTYVLLNKTINAYKVFNNYKDLLYNNLGIKPDDELTKLVSNIL